MKINIYELLRSFTSSVFERLLTNCNSPEFKAKLVIGNNSAAEYDTKFINFAELFTIANFEFSFKIRVNYCICIHLNVELNIF